VYERQRTCVRLLQPRRDDILKQDVIPDSTRQFDIAQFRNSPQVVSPKTLASGIGV
jgi:hypothetical protein